MPLAGLEFFEKIMCPKDFLIPTGHGVMGISCKLLDIIRSVFLRIELNGVIARQMVHESPDMKDFYLSNATLKKSECLLER